MPRTNRGQRLRPGERRRHVAWEFFAELSKVTSPWYDPKLPTILIQYEPKAQRKAIVRDIARALTTKLEREDQAKRGHLAIKIYALATWPESEPERRRVVASLRKSIREIQEGRRSRIDGDGIDLLRLHKWKLMWCETKITAPPDRDIAEQLKKQFNLEVTRDQVKNIRSRDYRDWFHPVWVEKRPSQHQQGLSIK